MMRPQLVKKLMRWGREAESWHSQDLDRHQTPGPNSRPSLGGNTDTQRTGDQDRHWAVLAEG